MDEHQERIAVGDDPKELQLIVSGLVQVLVAGLRHAVQAGGAPAASDLVDQMIQALKNTEISGAAMETEATAVTKVIRLVTAAARMAGVPDDGHD